MASLAGAASTRRKKDPPERKIGPFPNGVGKNEASTEQGPRMFRTITIKPASLLRPRIAAVAASYCYEQSRQTKMAEKVAMVPATRLRSDRRSA